MENFEDLFDELYDNYKDVYSRQIETLKFFKGVKKKESKFIEDTLDFLDNKIKDLAYNYSPRSATWHSIAIKKTLFEEFLKTNNEYEHNNILYFFLHEVFPQVKEKRLIEINTIYNKIDDQHYKESIDEEILFINSNQEVFVDFLAHYTCIHEFYSDYFNKKQITSNAITKAEQKKGRQIYTASQSVLLFVEYFLPELGYNTSLTDKTAVARLIHAIGADDVPPKRMADSKFYKAILTMDEKGSKGRKADLQFINLILEPILAMEGSALERIKNRIKRDLSNLE